MTVLKISLKAGERIFVNGAVLKADRKVTLEFLNTVTFLLNQHVLTPEDTKTPLRQLYFMIQTAIIDPKIAGEALEMADRSVGILRSTFENREILANLEVVHGYLQRGRNFDCLRIIRKLFPMEDLIIAGQPLPCAEEVPATSPKAMVASCR
jgi:flagellar biosynthesis repressor protein FlbT